MGMNKKTRHMKKLRPTKPLDLKSKNKNTTVSPKQLKIKQDLVQKVKQIHDKTSKGRVLKRKIYSGIYKSQARQLRKMQAQYDKQNGTYVYKAPDTIEGKRTKDITKLEIQNTDKLDKFQQQQIKELALYEYHDEFSGFFNNQNTQTKVGIYYNEDSSQKVQNLAQDLVNIIGPTSQIVYKQSRFQSIFDFIQDLIKQNFTTLICIETSDKEPKNMMVVSLPYGPTTYYALYDVYTRKELIGTVKPINQAPEVIMKNFETAMGRLVGRQLRSVFAFEEKLKARQVVVFHNQRDFIFFRAYRYIFDNADDDLYQLEGGKQVILKQKLDFIDENRKEETTARISEIGPEFTLRLRWIQKGIYNPQYEEFIFMQDGNFESKNRTTFSL